jgi:DNA-binding NarL/FixJ family response regulator
MGVRGDGAGSPQRCRAGRRLPTATMAGAPELRHCPLAVPDDLRACRLSFAAEQYIVVSFRSTIARSTGAESRDGALTSTERAVACAAAAGRSNRQIAAARGTSMHTVANQLASVYRKLGISSRAELMAAWNAPVLDSCVASQGYRG